MKRITLLLEDSTYRQVKEISRREGLSLKSAINALLRTGLSFFPSQKKIKIKIPCHSGIGLRPGVDISDRNALYDLLDLRI